MNSTLTKNVKRTTRFLLRMESIMFTGDHFFKLMACGLLLGALPLQGASDLPGAELTCEAGGLRLSLDQKGRVVELSDVAKGINYRHETQESALLEIQEYGENNAVDPAVQKPVSMSVISKDEKKARVELNYEKGAVVTVEIDSNPKYLGPVRKWGWIFGKFQTVDFHPHI